MFDIGWSELLLIGGVALVVIGPKDLPRALRTLGQTTTKVRRMAGDFQRQFNQALQEADMEDLRKGVSDVVDTARDLKNNFDPVDRLRSEIRDAIDTPARPATGADSLPSTELASAGDYLSSLPPVPDAPASLAQASQPGTSGEADAAGSGVDPVAPAAKPRRRKTAEVAADAGEADVIAARPRRVSRRKTETVATADQTTDGAVITASKPTRRKAPSDVDGEPPAPRKTAARKSGGSKSTTSKRTTSKSSADKSAADRLLAADAAAQPAALPAPEPVVALPPPSEVRAAPAAAATSPATPAAAGARAATPAATPDKNSGDATS